MAIGRNDNYVQWMFTADAFRKRWKRENSTVGPGSSSPGEASVFVPLSAIPSVRAKRGI